MAKDEAQSGSPSHPWREGRLGRILRSVSDAASVEPKRAQAVFRALQLTDDHSNISALQMFSGDAPHAETSTSRTRCVALANALRQSGYPLTDEGIRRFKLERGYSEVVRISPDHAAAYARFARGSDAKVAVDAAALACMDESPRRAIKVLLLIGRSPDELQEVLLSLSVEVQRDPATATILITHTAAEHLHKWAGAYGFSFDDAGLERLGRAMGRARVTLDEHLATFVRDAVLNRDEPAHDYSRTLRDGHVVNARTNRMLDELRDRIGPTIPVVLLRGSYHETEALGAHPHVAGGAVDISTEGLSGQQIREVVRCAREVGFAAWYRPRPERPHIHAIAVGDMELSPAAQWQVKCYFQGLDGRGLMGPDPHRGLDATAPTWTTKYRIPFA